MTPTAGLGPRRFHRLLAVRLLAMLSLALLPLGLIAIYQTSALTASLRDQANLSRLALTEQAALGERRVVFSALGTATALGAVLPELGADRETCHRYLRDLVAASANIANASFIPTNGIVTCAARDVTIDVSSWPAFQSQLEMPRIRVKSTDWGTVSPEQVVVVTRPVNRNERLAGFVSVAVPLRTVTRAEDGTSAGAPLATTLFNSEGEVVTYESQLDDRQIELPLERDLVGFLHTDPHVFHGKNANGEDRIFGVVPLIPGTVYALSAWPKPRGLGGAGLLSLAPAAFPIAMWVASLLVGYLAVHRLVIRHVGTLKRDMRAFALHRSLDSEPVDTTMSDELRDINEEFRDMAESLLRDEAALEDALRDKNELLSQKNVLMKEVHHRVKNNLQMITSIMNMQARKATTSETRTVLSRLQDRVNGLAAVHRNLYQTDGLAAVNAGRLTRDIADQLMAAGRSPDLEIDTRFDDVTVYPDQAVPLSLLTAEALTNALKYVARPADGGKARISVALRSEGDGFIGLDVRNTVGPDSPASGAGISDGLGRGLIAAFADQLEADIDVTEEPDLYGISLRFPVAQFEPAPEAGAA